MMWVSVKKLSQFCNPLQNPPWNGIFSPILEKEVLDTIALGWVTKPERDYDAWRKETRQEHVNRIAWYVKYGWGDSHITIDFTYDIKSDGIFDGNHRAAAAIIRGDEMIWADVYGSKDQIASLYEEDLTQLD